MKKYYTCICCGKEIEANSENEADLKLEIHVNAFHKDQCNIINFKKVTLD